jgi:rare lipoprotein A
MKGRRFFGVCVCLQFAFFLTDGVHASSETLRQKEASISSSSKTIPIEKGVASWYGEEHHGRPTASGEVFDQHDFTAAHPTLPLGTKVVVTNLLNGKSVKVRINDRGPFHNNRIIDLSYAAARSIGLVRLGHARVALRLMTLPK